MEQPEFETPITPVIEHVLHTKILLLDTTKPRFIYLYQNKVISSKQTNHVGIRTFLRFKPVKNGMTLALWNRSEELFKMSFATMTDLIHELPLFIDYMKQLEQA